MKKVAFQTLGCKLNFAETSTIGRRFMERGFEVVSPEERTDIYVLNTCSVTQRAERECRQLIRRALRNSPDAYIIVVGCYSQIHPEEIAGIEGVDLILGSDEKFNLLDYTVDFRKNSVPQIFLSCIDESEEIHPAFSSDVGGRTRAFLKIQDGCDYTCSFCTIPRARGSSRSLSPDEVQRQIHQIVNLGHKEIVLTGVNVGDYGRKNNTSLLELIRRIEKIEGIERVRISSVEPNLLSREMIDFVLQSDKFCKHFHIPLQSGSDTLLRLMHRRYTTKSYGDLIAYINTKNPDVAVGIDVITGFPGETDKLFNETVSFLEDLPFSHLHVFTYSERPGTPAPGFSGKIEPNVRYDRNELLRSIGQKKKSEFVSRFLGKSLPVLFEDSHFDRLISGLSSNYIRVSTEGDASLINQLRYVKITAFGNEACTGVITDDLQAEPASPVKCHL